MRIFSKPNRSRETLSPILQSHSCSKMATRLPNIVQPSAKMSQDSLRERPQHCKKHAFSSCFMRVLPSVTFCNGRAQDSTKVTKLLPKARQVAHLRTILAASWTTKTLQNMHFHCVLRGFLQCAFFCNLGYILSHSCSKMATRLPNIVQPSAKMSQDSLQERSQHCKKLVFSLGFTRVLQSVTFRKDRAQDSTKVTKMLPKTRQVAHLGAILAPR